MKIFLTFSLILNLGLGYTLLFRKPEKEVVERLIIETHADQSDKHMTQKAEVIPSKPEVVIEKKKKVGLDEDFEYSQLLPEAPEEFQDAGEKMETERLQFMMDTLGATEEMIEQHNKIREEFFRKTSVFWQKDPTKELNLEERRKMIDLEEDMQKKLQKLYGKKNWEKFQNYRDKYNREGYKKQMEEGRPFIFMGI